MIFCSQPGKGCLRFRACRRIIQGVQAVVDKNFLGGSMAKDYDPQMHTAEHVLNQTMVRHFGCGRCFSSHLNPGKARLDFHFSRDLTEAEARDLESAVNDVLAQNLPVKERTLPRSEAETLVNLSKLPASVGPDAPIRIVTVGDYDICPCIGAHVASTAEVGIFRLGSHDLLPPKEGQEDKGSILRLRFKLEPRP